VFSWHLSRNPAVAPKKSAVVYGTGELGDLVARQYKRGKLEYRIIGFVDDNPAFRNTMLQNIPVLGTSEDISSVLKKTGAHYLIIAINALSAEKMQSAIGSARSAGAEVLIIPSMFEVRNGKDLESGEICLRDVNLEDLLGRRLIEIDKAPIEAMVKGKTVLVTGAGGSIGSEICRQLLSFGPKQLLLLDIDETELHDLSLRLHDYRCEFSRDIFPICCDIKNKAKIEKVFESFKPQIVFHAAAYKHVPMMEYYPEEAIRTNILGSYNVLSSASENGAEKVIVISTDKAVNPTNVMGATKRFVELEASLLNNVNTEIVCVRFGNVLGSRGSMLPLFLEQIRAGRPITVTHKDIIRYFMAIPEAVSLVFLAGAMAKGGEVMVLDMGEPVKIYDFAQKLVKLFGDGRSKVVVTRLRPGEKLYEELLANRDSTIPTGNKKVFKARVSGSLDKDWLEEKLKTIETDSSDELVSNLKIAIPEFRWQGHAPLSDLFNE
jgi:Predicted nucleoside-diphosphate sugar epimerases